MIFSYEFEIFYFNINFFTQSNNLKIKNYIFSLLKISNHTIYELINLVTSDIYNNIIV